MDIRKWKIIAYVIIAVLFFWTVFIPVLCVVGIEDL